MRLLIEATAFASEAHAEQKRGNGVTPYVNHPIEVARILSAAGVADEEILAAALLHDVLEDTEYVYDDLVAEFGVVVTNYVKEVTDNPALTKEEMKKAQVVNVPKMTDGAKMIKIADKIANLTDIVHDAPDWSLEKKVAYFDWAKDVIAGGRGVNVVLDDWADDALALVGFLK